MFFGDYGIFLRREVFREIGGYDDIPFLEDVEICRKAKRLGRLLQVDRRFRPVVPLYIKILFFNNFNKVRFHLSYFFPG